METAAALPARFIAFPDAAPVVLRDVDDLHDADLEGILDDELDVATATASLAQLVVRPGSALLVHDLGFAAVALAR
jgi:hypothetical protein